MLKNTQNSYGMVAKLFHWIVSILILSLIAVGFYMTSLESSPEKGELYTMHKSFGVLVLSIIVLRIMWKISNKAVLPIANVSILFSLGAKVTHFLLYVFILIMPLSGIMMSRFNGYDISVFGLFTIPGLLKNEAYAGNFHTIHVTAIWGLLALIILHILGAFYHHFIRKDKTLLRMIKDV